MADVDIFGNKNVNGSWGRTTSKPKASSKAVKTGDLNSTSLQYKKRNVDTFNAKGQYSIENYSYPTDLMSADYGQNYVIFYINVSQDSKLLKDPNNTTVNDIPARDRGNIVAMNLSKGQVQGASAIEGAVAGGVAGKVVSGDLKGATKGAAIAGGLSYVGVEAIATQTSSFSRQQKRLSTAIALHVPNQLSIRYGTNWGEEDTSTFAMAATAGERIFKAITGAVKIDQLSGPAKTIAAAIALDKVPGKDAIQAATGLAPNPRKEQLFKNVDFRTFQFNYEFYPRDSKEAQNVLNIIYQFKLHMHPEFKDSSNFLYIYPSEFDIVYYQGTQENMKLHRHTSCVLTEMTVNYAPQGQFATFEDGMPTQINVTLNFRELAILTKEKIQDGL